MMMGVGVNVGAKVGVNVGGTVVAVAVAVAVAVGVAVAGGWLVGVAEGGCKSPPALVGVVVGLTGVVAVLTGVAVVNVGSTEGIGAFSRVGVTVGVSVASRICVAVGVAVAAAVAPGSVAVGVGVFVLVAVGIPGSGVGLLVAVFIGVALRATIVLVAVGTCAIAPCGDAAVGVRVGSGVSVGSTRVGAGSSSPPIGEPSSFGVAVAIGATVDVAVVATLFSGFAETGVSVGVSVGKLSATSGASAEFSAMPSCALSVVGSGSTNGVSVGVSTICGSPVSWGVLVGSGVDVAGICG